MGEKHDELINTGYYLLRSDAGNAMSIPQRLKENWTYGRRWEVVGSPATHINLERELLYLDIGIRMLPSSPDFNSVPSASSSLICQNEHRLRSGTRM
jgi:glutamate/tyrosine decarboxylase-like PLP-dependent enzyme